MEIVVAIQEKIFEYWNELNTRASDALNAQEFNYYLELCAQRRALEKVCGLIAEEVKKNA